MASADVASEVRQGPERTFGSRCRCGDCGAYQSEEKYLPCRRCGSTRRRLCDECYEAYLDWKAFQMGYL